MTKIALNLGKNNRSCKDCTKCCEGYLQAEIHGVNISGKGCQYLDEGVGCTIYEDRPEHPCRTFICYWQEQDLVPEHLKPSEANVIILKQGFGPFQYLLLIEAGETLRDDVLEWFLDFTGKIGINAAWEVNKEPFCRGTEQFQNALVHRFHAKVA
jgi:Fe-S-cluster containining protein